MTDNKELSRFFSDQTHPPSLWKFCDQKLHFFVLAQYLWPVEVRLEVGLRFKLTDFLPVFHVEGNFASNTPKKEENEMDYYPLDEVDENIRKQRLSTLENEPPVQTEQEHLSPTENDVHQMTAQIEDGHRKTSVDDEITWVRFLNTSSLPRRAINSVSLSSTVILQVVQENNRDIQKMKSTRLEQIAPPTLVNFKSPFLQKLREDIKRLEVMKETLCRKYFDNTCKVIYKKAVAPEACL